MLSLDTGVFASIPSGTIVPLRAAKKEKEQKRNRKIPKIQIIQKGEGVDKPVNPKEQECNVAESATITIKNSNKSKS